MRPDAIRLDYANMMADAIGATHGVTKQQLREFVPVTKRYAAELCSERQKGGLRFMDLPYQTDTVKSILATAKRLKGQCDDFVVLGIGGSALGNIALQCALRPHNYNSLPPKKRNGWPRIYVVDNVDPVRFAELLDQLDPKRAVFNVITKSGSTAETMSQFMVVRDLLKRKLGASFAEHIVVTTDAKKGSLRAIADREGYASFDVPDGVGGRFSVLTPVGLLSAAMAGIDICQLLAGAAAMDKRCQTDALLDSPAFLNAVLQFISDTRKGERISVMMPYSHALSAMADWFAQLWAESLGKKLSLSGKVVNVGPTPVKAVGVTDQHSQLQLYMEGPYDKVITFLGVERFSRTVKIPRASADKENAYLGGHSLNELMEAERVGTALALAEC
ncbi:MAG: glucose-6-phosphate isomerase, partial [Planctomycetes bacterium]|nr:glucose-6-phosphate isomerase [Planctomycetota bacterium]